MGILRSCNPEDFHNVGDVVVVHPDFYKILEHVPKDVLDNYVGKEFKVEMRFHFGHKTQVPGVIIKEPYHDMWLSARKEWFVSVGKYEFRDAQEIL